MLKNHIQLKIYVNIIALLGWEVLAISTVLIK